MNGGAQAPPQPADGGLLLFRPWARPPRIPALLDGLPCMVINRLMCASAQRVRTARRAHNHLVVPGMQLAAGHHSLLPARQVFPDETAKVAFLEECREQVQTRCLSGVR